MTEQHGHSAPAHAASGHGSTHSTPAHGASPGSSAGGSGASRRVDRRSELRRLAHDVRNALNGASVNLEVARTRAARAGADPAVVLPFLETAAQQLDNAARLYKQYTTLVADGLSPDA